MTRETRAGTHVPTGRRLRPPWLALLGLVVVAVGVTLLFSRKIPPADLAAAADRAMARARDGIGTRARVLSGKAQLAASVNKLIVALDVAEDDVATFQDLFSTEDWWAPFRAAPLVSALATQERALATTDPDLAGVKDMPIVAWARAGREASGVVAGQQRVYVAGAAPVSGFQRRPADGPVVVVAEPLDPAALALLAPSAAGAVGLSDGTRVIASGGAEDARAALPGLLAPQLERSARHGVVLSGRSGSAAFAGVVFPVGGTLLLLSAFPAPAARGSAAGLPLVLLGAALAILGLALGRGPRRTT